MKCTICGAEAGARALPRVAGTKKRLTKTVPRCLKHVGFVEPRR
jgi:hypothetical protein